MIEYRHAQQADIDVIIDLRIRMFMDMGEDVKEKEDQFRKITKEYFMENFGTDRLIQIVGSSQGKVVAVGIVEIRHRSPTIWDFSGKEGYIYNMYTIPEFRGQGIATQIVDQLLDIARQKGAKRVWLNATDQGRPIYQKAGFKAITRAMDIKLED